MFLVYFILPFFVHLVFGSSKPNVLIFLVDDFGWGDLGENYKQNGTSNTPFMDEFVRSGIRFTDFHVADSVCSPSRAALLTGRMGLRTDVNILFGSYNVGGLPLSEITLTDVLKQHSYNTFAIGKWHLGHNGPYHPVERRFDHYFGVPYSLDQGCLDNPGYIHPSRRSCTDQRSNIIGVPLYKDKNILRQPLDLRNLSNLYTQEFFDRIDEIKSTQNPFFGYIPFSHLHVPLGFDQKFRNLTPTIFGDTLRELDASFGSMIKYLKKTGLYDDTLIWLLGDNGPWEQECQYSGSPGPFKGQWQKDFGGRGASSKLTVWEAGHRVPAAVSWNGHIPKNTISNALVSSMDIFPTIVKIIGDNLPNDRGYDGINIGDILFKNSTNAHRILYHPRTLSEGKITAVRYFNFKAIYETGNSIAKDCQLHAAPHMIHNPPLLFDLDSDPAEKIPLNTADSYYSMIVNLITEYKNNKIKEINNDKRSHVDNRHDAAVKPCCNKSDPICRCKSLEYDTTSFKGPHFNGDFNQEN